MLGSITKAFTVTTVGELVAEGKMDWDTTPVNTYLPEFETIDPTLTSQLTMQDLLSHRTVSACPKCHKHKISNILRIISI
jgi:CubicO group peptidase (beta-lactamase class C family)